MAPRKSDSTTSSTRKSSSNKKGSTVKEKQVTPETKEVATTEEVVEEDKFKDLTVSQYFDYVKSLKKETDTAYTQQMLDICLSLIKKFEITNQKAAVKKATIAAELLKKDLLFAEKGFTTYVLLDDVTRFIKHVSNHNVKLTEIENFPREIPDDIIDKWVEVRDLFDKGYVVFTDYTDEDDESEKTVAAATGKASVSKDIEKRRKEKDPILFGAVKADKDQSSMRGNCYERLFYIGDWVDDYCDLTFDKMLKTMTELNIKPTELKFSEDGITKDEFKEYAGI